MRLRAPKPIKLKNKLLGGDRPHGEKKNIKPVDYNIHGLAWLNITAVGMDVRI